MIIKKIYDAFIKTNIRTDDNSFFTINPPLHPSNGGDD